MYLTNEELNVVNGGAKTIWLVIGGLALLAAGIFCGFFE